MRRLRLAGLALLLVVVASGCGDSSTSVAAEGDGSSTTGGAARDERVPPGPFRVVDHEDVYLNGAENDDRPPISFFLIGGTDSGPEVQDDAGLVEAYIDAMREDGWRVEPFSTDVDWWTFYGGRGSESVRVGPAEMFAELATADEGYARPKFRRLVSELDEPLVVVSIDPQD